MKNIYPWVRFTHEGKGAKCDHCDTVFKYDYMLQQHIEVRRGMGRISWQCSVFGRIPTE